MTSLKGILYCCQQLQIVLTNRGVVCSEYGMEERFRSQLPQPHNLERKLYSRAGTWDFFAACQVLFWKKHWEELKSVEDWVEDRFSWLRVFPLMPWRGGPLRPKVLAAQRLQWLAACWTGEGIEETPRGVTCSYFQSIWSYWIAVSKPAGHKEEAPREFDVHSI